MKQMYTLHNTHTVL